MAKPKEVKKRMHKALFDHELPFQPKVIKLKNKYQRHDKHRDRNHDH